MTTIPPPNNCNTLDVLSKRLSSYADFYINKLSRDRTDFDLKFFLNKLEEINVRSNVNCLTSKNVLEMYLIEKEKLKNKDFVSTKLVYSNLLNVNFKKPSDLNNKKYSLNKLKCKNVVIVDVGHHSRCVKSMIKYLQKHKSDLDDLKPFEIKNRVAFEKRSDNPKHKPVKAFVTMAAVTIKGNHYFFIMKMLNRKNLINVNSDNDNLLINFISVNGKISKDETNDKVYRLQTSKIQYFLNYTDFNPNNPDASVNVDKVHIEEWITKYNLDKNPSADSNILPYCPSTIVSYNNGQNRLNYICNITNITTNTNNGEINLIFTFDTSNVQFIGKSGESIENNPAITKIDTVFMEGTFNDIRIDFDPLYDPKYKYNADFSFFLQGDLTISKTKNNKFLGSFPMETNFIGYRNWNPTKINKDRNNILEVYCDNIKYITNFIPKDSTTSFTPSTTIEYSSNDGVASTNIVQIKDAYISKHTDDSQKVFFELDNEIVKFFNNKKGYKSVSKTLKEGIYYDVRMDIDDDGCGTMASTQCGDGRTEKLPLACLGKGCYYRWGCEGWACACCFNKADGCPNSCCGFYTRLATCGGYTSVCEGGSC
jgi:hypothetical protein